jgi:hypothetical protein
MSDKYYIQPLTVYFQLTGARAEDRAAGSPAFFVPIKGSLVEQMIVIKSDVHPIQSILSVD